MKFLSFTAYLTEAELTKNTHSTHLEDLIFDGKTGLTKAHAALVTAKNQVSGYKQKAVTKKLDGCVHENSLVATQDGYKKISELTDKDYVKTYDVEADIFEYYKNTQPHSGESTKQWVKLTFDNGAQFICTSDHPILDADKEYQEACALLNDTVYANTILGVP